MTTNFILYGRLTAGNWSSFSASQILAFWGYSHWMTDVGVDYLESSAIPLGTWNIRTTRSPATLVKVGSSPLNNLAYASPTELYKHTDVVPSDLTIVNISQTDVCLRLRLSVSPAAAVENACLFIYDGADIMVPPTGILPLAFERGASSILKDRVSEPGLGRAWDEDYGIGGEEGKLVCSEYPSTTLHYWYFGVSVKALATGSQTGTFRFECDLT